MIVYYNQKGIGDVLLVYLKDGDRQAFQREGDIVRIFDEETGETVGYNFFHAAQLVGVRSSGALKAEPALIEKLNRGLAAAGWDLLLPEYASPRIVTGYVRAIEEHPNSDHMHVCQVDCGEDALQIVCGAPNIDRGQKVVVAKIGALMPNGAIIRPTVLRGVASAGMICSARELGLPHAPQKRGILVLDPETEVGVDFYAQAAVKNR